MILRKITTITLLEFLNNPVSDCLIIVRTTKEYITIRGENLDDTIRNLTDAYIFSTTTKVINHNYLRTILNINIRRKNSSSRLIDNTQNIKTSKLTSSLNCITLNIIIPCRTCNNYILYIFIVVVMCNLDHMFKIHSRNLFRCISLVVNLYTRTTTIINDFIGNTLHSLLCISIRILYTHESLDEVNSIFRIHNRRTLGRITNLSFITLQKDHRRSSSATFSIFDNFTFTIFGNRYT